MCNIVKSASVLSEIKREIISSKNLYQFLLNDVIDYVIATEIWFVKWTYVFTNGLSSVN